MLHEVKHKNAMFADIMARNPYAICYTKKGEYPPELLLAIRLKHYSQVNKPFGKFTKATYHTYAPFPLCLQYVYHSPCNDALLLAFL